MMLDLLLLMGGSGTTAEEAVSAVLPRVFVVAVAKVVANKSSNQYSPRR